MNFKPHWDAKTRIELLERWILVQSYAYYELNGNIASDFDYDNNVKQLFELIKNNPDDHYNTRYYLYFDKRNPATYYEVEVPAYFNPNDNVSSAFKGKKVYVAYSNFINLKTSFVTIPQAVLTNNNGLIRPLKDSDKVPFDAHRKFIDGVPYYYWCDGLMDGYTGGEPYICFYVTPNETFSPREATFEFSYKGELLCTLKITQPTRN